MSPAIREVEPLELRLPPSRSTGVDPRMSDANTRAELFAALASLSESVPQMRLGQLLAALGELCNDLHGRGLWDAEDGELLEAVWRFRSGIEEIGSTPNYSNEERATAARVK
jgi:hypothetical protein